MIGGKRKACVPLVAALVLGGGLGVVAPTAAAATVTYYYAGALASLKRDPSVPDFNTGYLRLDPTRLPGGRTLANLDVTWSLNEWEDGPVGQNAEVIVEYDFALSRYAEARWATEGLSGFWSFDVLLRFDNRGELADWRFSGNTGSFGYFSEGYTYSISPAGESYNIFGWQYEVPPFEDYTCGPFPTCIDARIFRADAGGTWFRDDPIAFARQVEATSRAALHHPPQVIPVPPSLALALGGVAALLAFGRRWARSA